MKSARMAVILLVATALVLFLYRLRPKSRLAAPHEAAASGSNSVDSGRHSPTQAVATANENLPQLFPLPLGPISIEAEIGMWRTNSGYQGIPRGTQSFGGIQFLFDGMLQLKSKRSAELKRGYRDVISLGLADAGASGGRFGSLHLVCGTRWWTSPGSHLASVVWHYADGKSRSIPIIYMQHVRDWVRPPYEEPAHLPYPFSKVIWQGAKRTRAGRWQRLYRTSLPNPEMKKAVREVDLVSSGSGATLMVLAATLDRLPPGARPDDSPDLEPMDDVPPQTIQVQVMDGHSLPISSAQLRVQIFPDSKSSPPSTRYLTSDRGGSMTVAYPPSNQRRIELVVSHEGYGSRKVGWDLKEGPQPPATYTFKLGEAITIGGIVANKSSEPVMDAKLKFYRYWNGGEDTSAKREQADFSTRTVKTDASGRWELKDVPVELLSHIGFEASHPDYLAMNANFNGDEGTEKQLRAGTYKTVLSTGIRVAGRILDEAEKAIPGATVWSGQRFTPNHQKATSDSEGKFSFKPVEEGDVSFSAAADGFAAETKVVNVHSGMGEVVFHLKPGHVIFGIVQDENNQPVSGVRVVLEDTRTGNQDGLEFSTKTGADGRFEWKSAPDQPRAFYIGKQGYEQLRNKMLDVDVDNVVTLQKPRHVDGYVYDANTGQPVTNFTAVVGQSFAEDRFYGSYDGTKEFSGPDGHFELEIDDQLYNAVRVEATDYARQVREVNTNSRSIQVEFRLKPGSALKGIVIGQDGEPQAGAQVALTIDQVSPGNSIHLRAGRLESWDDPSRIVTTEADGSFSLNSPPETGGKVFAAGANGFGSAPVEEVRSGGRVVLQDFGQIEGTFKRGGAPASGQEFYFSMSSSGIQTDFNGYKVTTDENGQFKFTKLPAGEGEVVRLIQTNPHSWMHSNKTNVTVLPGQTIYLSLGDSGAVLKGMARLQIPPDADERLVLSGSLYTRNPAIPEFNSSEAMKTFFASAEWKAQMKARQYFAVAVATDNSFTIDSVPPGSYTLSINASRPRIGTPMMDAVASGSIDVEVPDNPDPFTPIQVGEIVLVSTTNNASLSRQ